MQQAIDPDAANRQSSVAEFRAQLLDGLGAPLPPALALAAQQHSGPGVGPAE